MAAVDEARAQLIEALSAWDFSPAYPVQYAGEKAPIIVPANPNDIIANFVTYVRDQQTKAILSVHLIDNSDSYRALGDHFGPGAAGLQRFGTRVELVFNVGCWADQQSGGPDLCQKLAGQVAGCAFYNRSRLDSYRALRTRSGQEVFEDRPQLWHADVVVFGDGVASYDA